MDIEDRLSVIRLEQLLDNKETSCCKNCEHYYPPICMHWVKDGKHIEVGGNDWCDKWEQDN